MSELLFPQTHEVPDTLHPEDTLRQFAKFLREVPVHYAALQEQEQYCNAATQDLLHFMELAENQSASRGYALYRRLSQVRRDRRACKAEAEILAPAVEFIESLGDLNQFIGKVTQAQGRCRTAKASVSGRAYHPRTTILAEFLEEGDSHGQE